MKHECEVILDLLPLYHDEVCSEKSREMVEEHLKECEMCQKALMEIRKEISAPNVSRQDAGKAWKTLTRNLWIRRVAAIVLAVVMTVAAAFVGKEIYEWDQERVIWMGADELNIEAYRLADGRVYVEFSGKEHAIRTIYSGPVDRADSDDSIFGAVLDFFEMRSPISPIYSGAAELSETDGRISGFRIGYDKEGMEDDPNALKWWDVIDGETESVVLVGADRDDITVICTMDDELPPATGEIEQRVAERDAWMAESMSRPGKGKE